VAADAIGFKAADVPKAEPYIDNENNVFKDIDMEY
jgi:hypothetical protein